MEKIDSEVCPGTDGIRIQKLPDEGSYDNSLAWSYYPKINLVAYSKGRPHHSINLELQELFPEFCWKGNDAIKGRFCGEKTEVYTEEEKLPYPLRSNLFEVLVQISRRESLPEISYLQTF